MARTFEAELLQLDGPAAWHFVAVPAELAPDFAGDFGRVPVTAVFEGLTWKTSVWRGNDGHWLLPVPKRIRRAREGGETVKASIEVDTDRL